MRYKVLLLTILISMLSILDTFSQTNTKQDAEKQKEEEVGTLDAAWKPVLVDHVFGVRGGYGMGSMRREPAKDNQPFPVGLYNYGISYRFDVPQQKYVGTIEIDVQWMDKGYAFATVFEGDEIYSRRYSVIELPILWQPYLPLGKGESRFFLNAGPYLSYMIDPGIERTYNRKSSETLTENKYIYDPLRDNRMEYGIVAGAGFMIGIKRFSFSIDFRYNIALSDVLKGVTKFEGNPFRSPVDQMNLSFGMQYRFIKGKEKKKK